MERAFTSSEALAKEIRTWPKSRLTSKWKQRLALAALRSKKHSIDCKRKDEKGSKEQDEEDEEVYRREKEEAPGSSEAAPEQALSSSEALTKEDTLEDGGFKVISESFDLVRFHELHAPIPVNTVPKYKLVLI